MRPHPLLFVLPLLALRSLTLLPLVQRFFVPVPEAPLFLAARVAGLALGILGVSALLSGSARWLILRSGVRQVSTPWGHRRPASPRTMFFVASIAIILEALLRGATIGLQCWLSGAGTDLSAQLLTALHLGVAVPLLLLGGVALLVDQLVPRPET